MSKKSILLKSIICASTYLTLWLLMFFAAYIDGSALNPFYLAIVFGIICGTVMAVVTRCAELKKTVLTRIIGVLSVIATDLILSISGIPHSIILYKYRNDAFVQETGRLTVNETIVFGWSNMFFWYALSISFAVVVVAILVYNVVKKRRTKNQTDSTSID